jgi:hypothetical protein
MERIRRPSHPAAVTRLSFVAAAIDDIADCFDAYSFCME